LQEAVKRFGGWLDFVHAVAHVLTFNLPLYRYLTDAHGVKFKKVRLNSSTQSDEVKVQ
jgi:hypothetical protein